MVSPTEWQNLLDWIADHCKFLDKETEVFKKKFNSESSDNYISDKDLASEIFKSERTVRDHLFIVYGKIEKVFDFKSKSKKGSKKKFIEYHEFFTKLLENKPPEFQEWLKRQRERFGGQFIEVPVKINISSGDWHTLFNLLQDIVLEDTIAACKQAFLVCKGSDPCHLEERKTLEDVKRILSEEDKPEIAVQFANAIAEQYATGSIRDNVIVWRDRLAQQHDITVTAPEPLESQQSIAAYLLITLQPSGYGDRDVWLGASLHLEEAEGIVSDIVPIEINAEKSPCSLDQVPEYLPKFITRAEQHLLELKVYQPLTLELFLPYNSLDHRVDAWEIKEQLDGEATTLGREYPVVVRSLDRFDRTRKPKLLLELGKRWNLLQEVVRNSMILQSFYSLNNHEIDKLDYQNLKLVLEERVGLKCSSQLPTDESDRRQLFKCILASGIPVTMWLYVPQAEPEETLEAFDRLLTAQNLSDFYSFAQQIRRVRCTPQHPLQHMGLLWDCPHRTPLMPSTQDPLKIPKQ